MMMRHAVMVILLSAPAIQAQSPPAAAPAAASCPEMASALTALMRNDARLRFRPDVIDSAPKVVVILAGTNDIAGNTGPMTNDEIQGNLASMSELAHAHGIRVVLASVTPVSSYHTSSAAAVPQTTSRPIARIQA